VNIHRALYADSYTARNAKAGGVAADLVRELEMTLTADARSALADAEVALALDLPLDLAAVAPNLRWVQAYGAGVGQIVRATAGTPIIVSTAAGAGAPAIAEFVLARLLQVTRRLRELDHHQDGRSWAPDVRGDTLAGSTMLVVGLGAIGTRVATLAHAFGMSVIATRRRPDLGPGAAGSAVAEVHPPDALAELLPRADVVVICAAETPDTAHLIGAPELDLLRPNAILINVARGALIDEPALVDALVGDRLAAAVLDVTETEPLPPDSPLWGLPNVYLSPHSSTPRTGYVDRVLELFGRNLDRYASGQPLLNVIDRNHGY
jgi:phosphoglycerate dehydrogenase-like enzyme